MTENLRVSELDDHKRLDVLLTERLPAVSRAHIQKLILTHAVTVNGQHVKANYKARYGDAISVEVSVARPLEVVAPEEIFLDIVYEDDDLIVVNKPKGMVVHPAPGSETGTLVNALLARGTSLSTIGAPLRPGIVHRLDKDTTGLLVVAKNDFTHESLAQQIRARTAVRKYNALLWGRLPFKHAVIDAPIIRHPGDRKRMTVSDGSRTLGDDQKPALKGAARDAVTEIRLLEHLAEFSWIEAILQTGRTHQIRVHCAFAGYPVVGDSTYGGQRKISADLMRGHALQALNMHLAQLHGQALHAHFLSFDHPRTKKRLQFHAPLPAEIVDLVDLLRRLHEALDA